MPQDSTANRHADAVPHSNPASPQDAPYYYVESNLIPFITSYRDAEPFKLASSMAVSGGGGWRNREGTQFIISETFDHTQWERPYGYFALIEGNTYYIRLKIDIEAIGDKFVAWHAELQVKIVHKGRIELNGDVEKIKAFYQYICTCGEKTFDPFYRYKIEAAEKYADKLWPLKKAAYITGTINPISLKSVERVAWEKATWSKNVSTLTLIQL